MFYVMESTDMLCPVTQCSNQTESRRLIALFGKAGG